jgi:hypothetical protein
MKTIIREKIALLEDFRILQKKKDPRKKIVREALKQCGSEIRMEQMLHDILVGRTTLDAVLQKKGLM